MFGAFPDWIKFFVTYRPCPDIQDALETACPSGKVCFIKNHLDQEADIRSTLRKYLSTKLDSAVPPIQGVLQQSFEFVKTKIGDNKELRSAWDYAETVANASTELSVSKARERLENEFPKNTHGSLWTIIDAITFETWLRSDPQQRFEVGETSNSKVILLEPWNLVAKEIKKAASRQMMTVNDVETLVNEHFRTHGWSVIPLSRIPHWIMSDPRQRFTIHENGTLDLQ